MTTVERDELIGKVASNPFDYFSFEKLLNILQELSDEESLSELRKYRIIFSERFTPELSFWQSWIADSIVSKDEVEDIFAKALLRFPDKNIVADFLDYKQRQYEDEQLGEGQMREAFEKAISVIGLDILDSGNFWKSYRDFEIDEYEDLVETQAAENKLQEAKIRIIKLFRRQLATPLIDNESVLQEFDTCLANICVASDEQIIDPSSLQINYEKALEDRETRLTYEQHLLSETYLKSNNEEKLNSWKSYLQLEIDENNIPRILRLYERSLLVLYSSKQLWREYTQFVAHKLKDWALTESITSRALITSYKESSIWKLKLIAMEAIQRSEEEISTTVQVALQSGLESADDYLTILLHHCQYQRRKLSSLITKIESDSIKSNNNINNHIFDIIKHIYSLRTSFSDAEQFTTAYYPTWITGKLAIAKYQSQVEDTLIRYAISKLGEDTAGPGLQLEVDVASIWEGLLKSNSKYFTVWMSYITWARQRESTETCRKLYKRALGTVTDYLVELCESWIEFETEVGSLQDLLDAEAKVKPKLKLVEDRRRQEADKEREKEKEKETLKMAHKRQKKITSLSDILPSPLLHANHPTTTPCSISAVSGNKYTTSTTPSLCISSDVRVRSNSLTVDADMANNTVLIPQTRRGGGKKRQREELLATVTSPHGNDSTSPPSDILTGTADAMDLLMLTSTAGDTISDMTGPGSHRKKEKRVTFVNPLTEVIPPVTEGTVAENGLDKYASSVPPATTATATTTDHHSTATVTEGRDGTAGSSGTEIMECESLEISFPSSGSMASAVAAPRPSPSLPTSHTIFVKNLSFESTEDEIKDFFTIPIPVPASLSASTSLPSTQNTPPSQESLAMELTAAAAAASDGLMITPLFVALTKSKSGKSRGTAQVHFIDEEGVRAALTLDGKSLRGRALSVERFGTPSEDSSTAAAGGKVLDPCTLYVEGFGKSIVENKVITDIFSGSGEIIASKISKDPRTGKGKGHALLQYREAKSLQEALLRHWKVKGRDVTVSQSWYPIVKKPTSDAATPKTTAISKSTNKIYGSLMSFKPRKLVLMDTAAATHHPLPAATTASTATNPAISQEEVMPVPTTTTTPATTTPSTAPSTEAGRSILTASDASQPVKTNADFRKFYE